MSPAALRAAFASCLTLGLADMAWLDVNASKFDDGWTWERLRRPLPVASTVPPAPVAESRPSPLPRGAVAAAPDEVRAELVTESYLIQFDRSLSVIRPDQLANLTAIAGALKHDPRAIAHIEGHTDHLAWKPNHGDNKTLSENRALAVARALGKLGVSSDRIRRAAFADTRPLDDRATEDAYRRNRRVEVRVELTGGR